MSLATSQLSYFTSIQRRHRFDARSYLRPKVLAVKSQGARSIVVACSESKVAVSYTEDPEVSNNGRLENTFLDEEEHVNENLTSVPVDDVVAEEQKGAKIHDFCFGIPYGGFVLSWGLIGSIFTRNLSTLGNGLLFGGALLALSIYSLKVWRQGKSSIPFVLGQAALSAVLLWKNLQSYTMTKNFFPIFLYAAVSAAMLCFYTYVVISGGNPPPKKLKSSEVAPS
ncbi:hypothetical protein DCAR_0417401 [Daucus carota subsp. sativus]|uniref:Protein FATTY ACID EXPORT 1, chloroplastic n=1 Tax=Daucus carota subsp. sativus TaxID=79200 RepID=A0AAF0WXS2_DAUCS|nr:PREDICTED: protein FATTY ACID EXPORT 1, chloroplastic [Daucus carota subsp. sativus]WOG98060.1 hypothetical protein DCAR_0417401 [Daucus carota subsp. sativus]